MKIGGSGFISYCKENRKLFIGIFVLSLLLCLGIYYMNKLEKSSFIMSGDKILGIKGDAYGKKITLEVVADYKGIEVSRQVTLKEQVEGSAASLVDKEKESPEELEARDQALLNVELDHLVREINRGKRDSKEDYILPESYGEDVSLKWKMVGGGNTFLLPLLLAPMAMVFFYRGRQDQRKKRRETLEQEIIKEIPSFSNKLILLLGCGLVYEESLKRIAYSGSGALTRVLLDVIDKGERTNMDPTKLLGDYASEKRITDLKRVVSVIIDNRRRGTDLMGKLSLEGDLLWEKRKKAAEEVGRASESKMAIPLGLMLVSLLVITAGPALMQM